MPRRHAGPDAGHAGAHTSAVAGADLFSDDASTFIDADDAGAVAVPLIFSDLRPYHARALGLAISGADASANTNTDAGALRETYAPADACALRVADAGTHRVSPAHARAVAQTYSETHSNADAAPYTYADHTAAVARADAEADASTDADADTASDHMAALARAFAETYTAPELPAHALADAAAFPLADRASW